MSWYSTVKEPTSFLLSLGESLWRQYSRCVVRLDNWGTLRVRPYVCRRNDDDDDDHHHHHYQWPSAWVDVGLYWTLFFPSMSLSFYPPFSPYNIQLLPGDPSVDYSYKIFNNSVWTRWGCQPHPNRQRGGPGHRIYVSGRRGRPFISAVTW